MRAELEKENDLAGCAHSWLSLCRTEEEAFVRLLLIVPCGSMPCLFDLQKQNELEDTEDLVRRLQSEIEAEDKRKLGRKHLARSCKQPDGAEPERVLTVRKTGAFSFFFFCLDDINMHITQYASKDEATYLVTRCVFFCAGAGLSPNLHRRSVQADERDFFGGERGEQDRRMRLDDQTPRLPRRSSTQRAVT